VSVIGFGCPALLSMDLSESTKDYVTTVVCDADVIPRSSGATILNLVLNLLEFDYTDRALRDVEETAEGINRLSPIALNADEVQNVIKFCKAQLQTYLAPGIQRKSLKRSHVVLFPPGRCLHVYRDGVGTSCCWVPCDFFSEIDVTRTMFQDHFAVEGYDLLFNELLRSNE